MCISRGRNTRKTLGKVCISHGGNTRWKSEQCAFRVVATRANSTDTFEKVIINETADLDLQRRSSQDRPSCESRPATLICQVEVPVPNLDVRDSLWLSTVVNDDVSIIINSG